MGTPEFAVPGLQTLIENGYEVAAVITSVDKLGGRGRKQLIESDVKKFAAQHNIKILQPPNLKRQSFIDELKSIGANLQIVVAFRMLPEVVWNMPELGTYNLHGSILPKYRGAAPINWAIMNGDKETGVSFFKLKHEIDTGDILIRNKLPIGDNENASSLHDRMKILAAETVLEGVKKIESQDFSLLKQDESEVSKAPKIFKKDCLINFDESSYKIHNHIRGLSYYPAAWFKMDDLEHKVYQASYYTDHLSRKAGKIFTDNKSYLHITTNDGYLFIKEIQQSGKRRMSIKEFLNGYDVKSDFINLT
jgi:methionyl-tRNA formyltransferase